MSDKEIRYRVSREDFERQFGDIFDRVFHQDERNKLVPGDVEWEQKVFGFGLWDFVWDTECFEAIDAFVSLCKRPCYLILAEVESVERFTEVLVVPFSVEDLQTAVGMSVLPHFLTACFDSSGEWAVIFENELDRTIAARKSCPQDQSQ